MNSAAIRAQSDDSPACAFVAFEPIRDWAHTVHILKMWDAFMCSGVDTTLLMYPDGDEVPSASDLQTRYALSNTPRISWIPRNDNRAIRALRVLFESFRAGRKRAYAYTTRALPALGALLGGTQDVFLEFHQIMDARSDRLAYRLGRHSKRLHTICISQQLSEIVAQEFGFDSSGIIVEHSGHSFPIHDDYDAASSAGRPLRAMYVGTLLPGKGVETIFDLARRLPNVDFVIVGGTEPTQALPQNVTTVASVPHASVPELMGQADILLLPYTKDAMPSSGKGFFSPLKMVEYLSAGRSIVSSRLPSISEVLVHESNCLLVEPESTEEWSAALERLERDPALRERLAHAAAETAASHTNLERVRRIFGHAGHGRHPAGT